MSHKDSAESVVRQIRRKTRRKYSAEDKSESYWKGCEVKTALPNCAVVKIFTNNASAG